MELIEGRNAPGAGKASYLGHALHPQGPAVNRQGAEGGIRIF
jgi:hypothetical protein